MPGTPGPLERFNTQPLTIRRQLRDGHPPMQVTPTSGQVRATRAVVRWYLDLHYLNEADTGTIATFCSKENIGEFAVQREAIERGEPDVLFKLLVSVAMFQRLRDALVMNILKRIPRREALVLTSPEALQRLAADSLCPKTNTNRALIEECDLAKDALGRGTCGVAPTLDCHLKVHTELLRRYGHFGKMPTSAALVMAESGGDICKLREQVLAAATHPQERARGLEAAISKVWRVSDKISNLFLSLLCAPNLGLSHPPWTQGIDWTWFVVVDRNVDLFLETIDYCGSGTYSARRAFIRELASKIDLRAERSRLPSFHPRLVQQAMYLFMSRSNRRNAANDCSRAKLPPCSSCPKVLQERCPVRP